MGKLILFLIMIFSQLFSGQNIESSRKTVEKINQIQGFKIKIVPNSYFSDKNRVTDNGIELKGYYKNNKLLKMEYWVGLSAWKIITEYFFSDNAELVFVHSKKYQIVGENGYLKKPQLLSEVRCYYDNDKVIKTIGVNDNDEKIDFLQESKNLMNDLKHFNN